MSASTPVHGWYPDPNGSGGQRYWDGGAWTTHCRPWPAVGRRGLGDHWRSLSGNARTLVISVAVAVVLVTFAIGAALNRDPSRGGMADGAAQTDSTSAPADWIASVCRRGTYHQSGGHQLPNASSSSWCQSQDVGSAINFFTYSSTFLMNNDLHFGAGSYATYTDSNGVVWLVRSFSSRSSVLAPLSQFGFTVHDQ